MQTRRLTLVIVAVVSVAFPALPQTDPYAMAHAAAANELGVMEYCQSRGDIGNDAVAAQRSAIARLPASTVATDADEALGKQGAMSAPNGARITLDSMASSRTTTVSAICKQLGASVVQSAAAFQQSGMATPGMPAMPNGMTMPSMPATPPTPQ